MNIASLLVLFLVQLAYAKMDARTIMQLCPRVHLMPERFPVLLKVCLTVGVKPAFRTRRCAEYKYKSVRYC